MSFDDILLELRRRKWLLAMFTTLGITAGIVYWAIAPREYESTARVLVMNKDPAMASSTQEAAVGKKEDVTEDALATHLNIIHSDAIIEKALQSPELANLSSIEPYLREDETPVEYVTDRLWVFQGTDDAKAARTIDVAFRHHDAEDCRRIVSAVVASYRSFLKQQFHDINTQAASLITQAEGQLEKEIESLEREHAELLKRGPIRVTRGEHLGNVHEETFADIQKKISELQIRLAAANDRLTAIRTAKSRHSESPAGIAELGLIGEDDLPRLTAFTETIRARGQQPAFLVQQPVRAEMAKAEYERLSALRAEERSLLEDFGPKHPDVIKKRNDIAFLEKAIEKRQAEFGSYERSKDVDAHDIVNAYQAALESDVTLMGGRLAELRRLSAAEEAKAKEVVNFDLNDKIMSSRIERKQQLYDAVVSRLHDLDFQSTYGSYINEVLVPPKTGKKVWPRLWVCLLGGFVLGGMLGSGLCLGLGFRDSRFRTLGELKSALPFPVLVTVPRLEGADNDGDHDQVGQSGAAWDRALDVQFQHRSAAADAIRALRNGLLLSQSPEHSTLLLVTSPEGGDGKSVLCANLALSLAYSGRSVLLVDAHFARPRQHALFGCDEGPGLGEVLQTDLEPQDALVSLGTHLRLLPAGALEGSPADAFQTRRFGELCSVLRERFDYVVIDGAPVLESSASHVLASSVDQVLLVTRPSRNDRLDVLKAVAEMKQHGGELVGAIANSWDASTAFAADPASDLSLQTAVYSSPRAVDVAPVRGNGSPKAIPHIT
jgi:polysaccharide biosynthesis transport protein